MPQNKNPQPESGEELVNKAQGETDPMDPSTVPEDDPTAGAKTVEEADPGKKTTYPVKWEYHVMMIQDTTTRFPADQLNGLGREGWEMVAIFHLHATVNFVFKRFVL